MRTIVDADFAHILEPHEEWAIKAALAANRPLLVRGEPGVGKTQLAQAAAIDLKRPLRSLTVDSGTEATDLLWTFDAVQRLAEAQVASMTFKDPKVVEDRIRVSRFVRPGPLWWAFDWNSAEGQLDGHESPPERPDGWQSHEGVVILIDEIDKAESDVPNGLLEAFGSRRFTPQGFDKPVRLEASTAPPLVVITTNEERMLPDAFVRRCFVLHMQLPEYPLNPPANDQERSKDQPFIDYLKTRGRAHFPNASDDLLSRSAELLLSDRREAKRRHWSPLPGLAEYLDFLRAIEALAERGEDPKTVFDQIQSFVFRKSQESV